ncbi:MAG: hypothetical protein LBS74_02185 [Oscillospiraceae bacterium]|jgi:hypothetical protein|nr:hypothetical protein [Oscillospiraceae bacterium]
MEAATIAVSAEILKHIGELVQKNAPAILAAIQKSSKDRKAKKQIDCGEAFRVYLIDAFKKYSNVRTFLAPNPQNIADIYVAGDIQREKKKIST